MEVKLSVIVPVYNIENYLAKCLDSILQQTLREIEVICVNDGSTDGSDDILREYQAKDDRIVVIEQENQGLGAARNAGIMQARGEYVGFVDSDDFIAPTMFEKLYSKACDFNSDIVITNVYLYYTDTGAKQFFRDTEFYGNMDQAGCFTLMQHPRLLWYIGVWDRIYRREFLESHKILNPVNRIYEDVLFTIQSDVYAKRISVVNEPLYYYRKNTGRSIVDKERTTDAYKLDFLKNLRESRNFLIQCSKWIELRREFLAFQFSMILYHQYNTQSRRTFIAFMKELSEILDTSDMDIITEVTTIREGRIYIALLKRGWFALAYALYKAKKLYKTDELYVYLRFPRCKKYWHFKKPGYRWKLEQRARYDLVWELKQLNKSIEALRSPIDTR